MHFGFIFAMEEEAVALNKIFSTDSLLLDSNSYKIIRYTQNHLTFTVVISGIGKAFAASAVTLLIEKYNVDAIINIGAAGGISCNVGDIVISNQAMYHDVDVTAFGYSKGQIPKQPLIFKSKEQNIQLNTLINTKLMKSNVVSGCVATGDQFVNDINVVNNIKLANKDVKALDMEAAAIAQIAQFYNKDFIFIKKISDLADNTAQESFKEEITNFDQKVSELIKQLLCID